MRKKEKYGKIMFNRKQSPIRRDNGHAMLCVEVCWHLVGKAMACVDGAYDGQARTHTSHENRGMRRRYLHSLPVKALR